MPGRPCSPSDAKSVRSSLAEARAAPCAFFCTSSCVCGNLPPFSITLRQECCGPLAAAAVDEAYFFAHRQYLALFCRKRQISNRQKRPGFCPETACSRTERSALKGAATAHPLGKQERFAQQNGAAAKRFRPAQRVPCGLCAAVCGNAPHGGAQRPSSKECQETERGGSHRPGNEANHQQVCNAQREGGDQSQTAADGKNGKADERDERMALLRPLCAGNCAAIVQGWKSVGGLWRFCSLFSSFFVALRRGRFLLLSRMRPALSNGNTAGLAVA